MSDLTLALVQSDLVWESPAENRNHFQKLILNHSEPADIFILPEMFTTGFSMNAESAELFSDNSPTILWMKDLAAQKNAAICGSVIMSENGERFNRFLWVDTTQVITYDKRHLFSYGNEHKHFSAGKERTIIQYKGWKILPQICYDLRFPVFARNHWKNNEALYDLMIYVANWPDVRINAWDALGVARAIENQSYVALVNRTGTDGSGLNYVGHSALVDTNGAYLIPPIHQETGIFTSRISKEKLVRFRERFPLLKDADDFELK